MKILIPLLFVAAVACGKSESGGDQPPADPKPTTEAPAEPVAPAEPAEPEPAAEEAVEVPTAVDYEEQAAAEIDEKNLEAELKALESELAEE